jgi:hypothetical protein
MVYNGIRVTPDMKNLIITLIGIMFLFSGLIFAEEKTITCDAPTLNEDGRPITNLAGYLNCVSYESGVYNRAVVCDDKLGNIPCCTDIGNNLSYTMIFPDNGMTFYVARVSYKTSGIQSSGYSDEVVVETTDLVPPGAGGGCSVRL